MTREQWERVDMLVENPSRGGINNILLTVDDEGKWEITTFKNSPVPDSLEELFGEENV